MSISVRSKDKVIPPVDDSRMLTEHPPGAPAVVLPSPDSDTNRIAMPTGRMELKNLWWFNAVSRLLWVDKTVARKSKP